MRDRRGGKGFQARGGIIHLFLLLFERGAKACLGILRLDATINFVEGKDDEKADNNLHFIGVDVGGSC